MLNILQYIVAEKAGIPKALSTLADHAACNLQEITVA